jgi:DNA repair protein RecO (recombination protein O)
MLQKTRGIVLHSLKYGETGMITTIYTEVHGRMSFIMQGIHGKRSQVKANLLRQLSLLEMEVDFKQGRELQRVREVKNSSPFVSIPYEISKSSQALFLAELLHKVLREEEARPELFEFLYRSIQMLDLMDDGIANFHLLFLIQLTRYLGFEPTNNHSPSNRYFDMIAGKFVIMPPDHPWFLKELESEMVARLLGMNYQSSSGFMVNSELRNLLLTCILDYYGLHFGNKLNVKSLEILKLILH